MSKRSTAPDGISGLLDLMRRLRDPQNGCPWDRKQTFETIAPYTIEEAYEVADAIARNDLEALKDELGDLLFQVVFHAQMAAEADAFSFSDVVAAVVEKMTRRHPHVFGDTQIESAEAQIEAWEAHKAEERRRKGEAGNVLDGIPLALPALMRAHKIQRRLQRVGFDWQDAAGVIAKVREELGELEEEIKNSPQAAKAAEELGDLLFACANLGRFLGADPEAALRSTNEKVERRFRAVEKRLAAEGRKPEECDLAELDRIWNAVKADERR